MVGAPGVEMGWFGAGGGDLGTCPGGGSPSDALCPFTSSFQMCWGFLFGVFLGFFFDFQFFPLTLYFFSFIKSHMYFEFLWCRLFSGGFPVLPSASLLK